MKPFTSAAIVFLVILAGTAVTDAFGRDANRSEVRAQVTREADTLARDLSDVIARETAAVETLAAFVEIAKSTPERMDQEFPKFADALIESGETIRSVQLAPDSVIHFVFPLDGNEAALDLDLLADPDRKALLEPAIQDGSTVVQGPVELVQGGLGVLVRRPIYNDDGSYWGLAAILLDWPAIAARTEIDNMDGGTLAGARLADSGKVIAGEEEAFEEEHALTTLRIGATDTVWEVAVKPDQWPGAAPATPYVWVGGLLIAAMAAMWTFSLAKRPQVLRQEREKALSDLAFAEARYRATYEHAAVGIAIIDTTGTILSANPALHALANRDEGSGLKGTLARDLVHPTQWEEYESSVRALFSGQPVVESEIRVIGDGERWCKTVVTLIEGTQADTLLVAIVEDITVKKMAEIALAESESRFRQLFEQAPIAIQREDYSEALKMFRGLRRGGVTDLRSYLSKSSDRVGALLERVTIVDANAAAIKLQGHLVGGNPDANNLVDKLTPQSEAGFVETLVAIWEGHTSLVQSVETSGPDGTPLYLDVRWTAPLVEGEPDFSRLMVTIADITELREAQRNLEELIESKDRFVASVAHELRTPLTAVVGFAQELKDELQLYGEPEKEEFRDLIAFHSTELSHIIEDLLVWARGDIGEVRIVPESIDLATVVRQTMTTIRGAKPEVAEPDGPVSAFADPGRLRQIVRNLTTNALRYGGEDVEVVVRVHNGAAVVEVADNGPRMSTADIDRIFEPYVRAKSSTTVTGSIGLGLTVSRSLARLQGGDLIFLRVGERNVFRATLPLDPAPAPQGSPVPV